MEEGKHMRSPYHERWEEDLRCKNKEELLNMVNHSKDYAPEFIMMVKEKLEKEFNTTVVEVPVTPPPSLDELNSTYEQKLLKRIGGLLRISSLIVICLLLVFFAVLCCLQAKEHFSYWKYMDGLWCVFAACCACCIIFFLIKGKIGNYFAKRRENRAAGISSLNNQDQIATRDLLLDTLTKIKCQYEIEDGEDGDIHFAYQGEYFTVRASNDCRYVQIFDIRWGHVELYDVDELSRLRKAINESNLRNSVTAVYTVDEAGGNVDVHCKSVIPFIPEIPNLEDYLRLELNEYFQVHQFIGAEMARQRELEAKNA